ncbi:BrnA antitoxin family protein [Antarcticirhabdus aurantiaca]|uniref:BrnA antitoxin family protein n=1 Tax=Antarcticirhabdus aurantiaca TaxID=2606717 RepID=A0ACD4NI20_9HYPH|nr:BrnA antitoxin family protein [Antarcticirhabdus aurantiaca]WAJ26467.1 BrnA antitoxin family protein [Jeongeuplla avenae]
MARRPINPFDAAEAVFKPRAPVAAKPAEAKPVSVPGTKEEVKLKIDQDVLHHFQEDGPGWQDRINAALRRAAGLTD